MTLKKAHGYQLSTMANSLKIASNRDFHQKRNFHLKSTLIALENSLDEVNEMIKSINNQQVTKEGVFKFILEFGKI